MAKAGKRLSRLWICSRVLAVVLVCVQSPPSASAGGDGSRDGVACSTERGQCLPSQPPRPDCAADDGAECTNAGDPASLYNPGYVDYPLSGECRSAPSSNSLSPSPTVARGLTAILYPTGRNKKYNLYVSWLTTTDSNTQGFYIWSYKCSGSCRFQNRTESAFPYFEKGNYECLPIPDPNARSVLFDGAAHRSGLLTCKDGRHYTPDRCNSPDVMTVMVVPKPRSADVSFSGVLATSSLTLAWKNLDRCWPTVHSDSCLSPVFIRPVEDFNLTATTTASGRMEVHVSWPCSPGDVEYVVTITDTLVSAVPNCTSPGSNPPCFLARDTTHVTIRGLDMRREYSISVQVMPRCNGSSFSKHYVGCRSEDCCRAKRVGPMNTGTGSSLPVSVQSSRVKVESACIGVTSSGVGVDPSSTTLTSSRIRVDPSKTTSTSHLYPSPSVPAVPSTTRTPPHQTQRETGRVGGTGPMIGVAVAVVLVVFLVIVSAVILVSYLARRRIRSAGSLTTASSLTESLETLEAGGEGAGYLHLVTLAHTRDTPTYAVTANGTEIGGAAPSAPDSPEGTVSQTTIEVGSIAGGSGTTTESEKISGISMSLDDDAFESSSEKSSREQDSNKEELCQNGGSGVHEGVGLPKKVLERSRAESVRVKTTRNGSSSSHRKRPRSLSTSHSDHSTPPSALILYSKASPELEQRAIQQLLVSDLTQYNVRTVSEETSTPRECPASWLEAQMREVSAVFCVCNEAFDREWENRTDGFASLVPVFKQLCHGLVTPSYGKNEPLRDKISIVLPRDTDLQYVPTYLNSRPKFLLQNRDLVKMARFAASLPQFHCITPNC